MLYEADMTIFVSTYDATEFGTDMAQYLANKRWLAMAIPLIKEGGGKALLDYFLFKQVASDCLSTSHVAQLRWAALYCEVKVFPQYNGLEGDVAAMARSRGVADSVMEHYFSLRGLDGEEEGLSHQQALNELQTGVQERDIDQVSETSFEDMDLKL
ncbi:hypothetical protein CABS02_02671 [Colletotrichum abscissum]|uniref:Uncharacterized protein n=1 Tax=Colletotrichum abscissum TaxID=1671311 RepID=A0A9Q0B6M1_9PEZI|nr:hypothetical protein CABS02_02671 [Colletotrichum abscissum]